MMALEWPQRIGMHGTGIDWKGPDWTGSIGPEWIIKDGLSMERNGLAAKDREGEASRGAKMIGEAAAEVSHRNAWEWLGKDSSGMAAAEWCRVEWIGEVGPQS